MTIVVVIIILVLVIFAGIFGGAALKRGKNSKLCQSGYYCILIGPDRAWMKVLPAENGLIIKPEGDNKKKFYKKNEPEIPWATNGYIVPKEGPVPTVPWPVEAHSSTQTTVGMLIYHVGCAMPLGYNEKGKFIGYGTMSGAAPEIIAATYKSRDTMDLFNDSTNESTNTPVGNSKSNIWNIIIIIGIVAAIIIGIVTLLAVNGGIGDLKNGFGL
jgi:hypothetical protein